MCAAVWVRQGPPDHLIALAVLVLLAILSQAGPSNNIGGTIGLSIHSVVVLAAVAVCGPVGAALVGACGFLWRFPSMSRRGFVFNSGMLACCGALSGVAYQVAHGIDPDGARTVQPALVHVALPLMVADIVLLAVNVCLLSGIQTVSRGAPFRSQVAMLLSSVGVSYLAYGVIALLLVLLWLPAEVGPFSLVLIIAPLIAAQWGLGRYGAELTAHNRTLGALVAAIETKTPAAAGQSAVVAELSEWVAEELALPARDVEAARTAGMLHDVGLLAVPVPLLDPARVLTTDERRVVQSHLAEAAGMLRGISFLDRALVGIVHHGERVDGTGYPSQLIGDQIPPVARIVAVAGAYASLVTTRSDRPALEPTDALAVLRELAGTAYDPTYVAALGRAIARHPAAIDIPATRLACQGSAVALDDPPVRFHADTAWRPRRGESLRPSVPPVPSDTPSAAGSSPTTDAAGREERVAP